VPVPRLIIDRRRADTIRLTTSRVSVYGAGKPGSEFGITIRR
jgi:hypothetical protein